MMSYPDHEEAPRKTEALVAVAELDATSVAAADVKAVSKAKQAVAGVLNGNTRMFSGSWPVIMLCISQDT